MKCGLFISRKKFIILFKRHYSTTQFYSDESHTIHLVTYPYKFKIGDAIPSLEEVQGGKKGKKEKKKADDEDLDALLGEFGVSLLGALPPFSLTLGVSLLGAELI